MEASIMLEGFKASMEFHGLVYKTLIADGDSSAFFNIKYAYNTPELNNIIVEKVECKNHALRRMNVNLAALQKQKNIPSFQKKHLKNRASSIGKYVAYAIEHNRLLQPATSSSTLQKDILNSLTHCFGLHTDCSEYLCSNMTLIVPETLKRASSLIHNPKPVKGNIVPILKNTTVWNLMVPVIKRIADLSDSLMHGATTNIAESFQSQVAKFIRGKRVNYSGRGGFNRRVACATMAFRNGPAYYTTQYRLKFGMSPSSVWKKMERVEESNKTRRQRLGKRRKIRKLQFAENRPDVPYFSKRRAILGNKDYGSHANAPSLEPNVLAEKVEDYINEISVTVVQQKKIEEETRGQFDNNLYRKRRKCNNRKQSERVC
jgi:hypothetical protein